MVIAHLVKMGTRFICETSLKQISNPSILHCWFKTVIHKYSRSCLRAHCYFDSLGSDERYKQKPMKHSRTRQCKQHDTQTGTQKLSDLQCQRCAQVNLLQLVYHRVSLCSQALESKGNIEVKGQPIYHHPKTRLRTDNSYRSQDEVGSMMLAATNKS